MLPTEQELLKMSLPEIEHLLHGCFQGSDTWNIVWPVYESKKRRAEVRRSLILFIVPTAIALAALIRSFFPAPVPQSAPAPVVNSSPAKDPLSLFHSNPPLEKCLTGVNPKDPLGIRTTDAEQDRKRQACIDKFASAR
jgi:hypothetical protein